MDAKNAGRSIVHAMPVWRSRLLAFLVCARGYGTGHVLLKGFERRQFDDVLDPGPPGRIEGIGFQRSDVWTVDQHERLLHTGERGVEGLRMSQIGKHYLDRRVEVGPNRVAHQRADRLTRRHQLRNQLASNLTGRARHQDQIRHLYLLCSQSGGHAAVNPDVSPSDEARVW